MLQYQATWRPAILPMGRRPRVMAQAVVPQQNVSTGVQVLAHTLALGMGAATAWVGFDTGARRKGFLSVLGYVIGVGGAISALMDFAFLGVLGYRAVTGKTPAPDSTTPLPLM
jgi:hypothetical protein